MTERGEIDQMVGRKQPGEEDVPLPHLRSKPPLRDKTDRCPDQGGDGETECEHETRVRGLGGFAEDGERPPAQHGGDAGSIAATRPVHAGTTRSPMCGEPVADSA